jgi:hypothetical protein
MRRIDAPSAEVRDAEDVPTSPASDRQMKNKKTDGRGGRLSGAVCVLRCALEVVGCCVTARDVVTTDDGVRRRTESLCACPSEPFRGTWIARGASIAPNAILPPDDKSRADLLTYGIGARRPELGAVAEPWIVVQAPYGPPLVLGEESMAPMAKIRQVARAGRYDDPRFHETVAYVRGWAAAVERARDDVFDVVDAVRAAFETSSSASRAPPPVRVFIADLPTLWDDPEHSPRDMVEPTVMVTGAWRALRWFESDWAGDGPLAYVLVMSDDLGRWMAYEPGITTAASVRAFYTMSR